MQHPAVGRSLLCFRSSSVYGIFKPSRILTTHSTGVGNRRSAMPEKTTCPSGRITSKLSLETCEKTNERERRQKFNIQTQTQNLNTHLLIQLHLNVNRRPAPELSFDDFKHIQRLATIALTFDENFLQLHFIRHIRMKVERTNEAKSTCFECGSLEFCFSFYF